MKSLIIITCSNRWKQKIISTLSILLLALLLFSFIYAKRAKGYTVINVRKDLIIYRLTDGEDYGLMDLNGKTLIEPTYNAYYFTEDYILFLQEKDDMIAELMIIDSNEPNKSVERFENIKEKAVFNDAIVYDLMDGRDLIMRFNEEWILRDAVDETYSKNGITHLFAHEVAIIQKGNRFGAINTKGEIIIEPTYTYLSQFFYDSTIAAACRGTCGAINLDEEVVVYMIYSENEIHQQLLGKLPDLTAVHSITREDDAYGIRSSEGEIVIPFIYESLKAFDAHLYIASMNDSFGLMNTEGGVVLPFEFEEINLLYNGLYHPYAIEVVKQDKVGIYSFSGEVILPPTYDEIRGSVSLTRSYREPLVVKQGNSFGLVDHEGNIILPIEYESISTNPGGIVVKDNRHYFYDYPYWNSQWIEQTAYPHLTSEQKILSNSNGQIYLDEDLIYNKYFDFKVNLPTLIVALFTSLGISTLTVLILVPKLWDMIKPQHRKIHSSS